MMRLDPDVVMESSVVVQAIRPMAEDSLIVRAIAAVAGALRRVRARPVASVSGGRSEIRDAVSLEQLTIIASESRFLMAIESWLSAPARAWREARVRQAIDPILRRELSGCLRLIGWGLLVAVLTHTVLLGAMQAPVEGLGWGVRAWLAAVACLVMWKPGGLVSAWKHRDGRWR